MIRIVTFVVAVALASLSASAAEPFGRGSTKDAPVALDAPAVSWAGFYAGGQVGYGFSGLEFDTFDIGLTKEEYDAFIGLRTLTGGLYGGFDMQVGRFVAGPIAEANFVDVEEVSYQWAAGGRGGFLVTDNALIYGVLMYSQLVFEDDRIDSVDGIKYGGGVELALTNNLFMNLSLTQTVFDVEGLPGEIEATDNRGTIGFHLKFGGNPLPSID